MSQSLSKAVLLTGAAARISQEVALFDQLRGIKESSLKGLPLTVSQDDTLLTGFSSGSLNLAAINACFSNGCTLNWDSYYKQQVLFPLRNQDVYKIKMFPWDTTPLCETITKFLNTMNCEKPEDLAFYSFILTFSWSELETIWVCSQNEEDFYLNLTDVFMASTAIPVLFPSQKIGFVDRQTSSFPGGQF